MARNPIPESLDRLFALATDMIDGVTTIGTATGVVQNTATVLTNVLAAARSSEAAFQKARQAKTDATTAQTTADSNAKTFIATAKRILIPHLGATWSTVWAQVGYVNGSLEMPSLLDERFTLLGIVRTYLVAQPTHENAPLGITAAAAQLLITASTAARSALNAALQNLATARLAREVAVSALRTRMRGLISELATLLPADDARWYTFGLSAPGDPETPGVPSAAILTPGISGSGLVFLDWPDTRRTDRYRVWQKKPGDIAFTAVATVSESDATLSAQPIGILLQFQITAINAAGESVPSAVSSITLS